ncbi:MAG: rod shape-determining protein MreC [Candidatus Binataceae bacterium]
MALTAGTLLILALHLLLSGTRPGARASRPAIALIELLRPVQALEAGFSAEASGFIHDYLELVGTRRQNDALRKELAELESQRARTAELEAENRRLGDLLELRDALATKAIAANVIGSDATGLSRTLIIGQGSRSGFRRDMAVIAAAGVVGKLIAVAPDAARVLLIDDHNSALDAIDQRSRARGIVAGVPDDGLTLKYVDRTGDLKPGDAIVTSGMDGIFPRGLLVGEVARVSQEGPGLFLNIEVAPAADFRKLEQVLVLTQKPPELQIDDHD